MKVDPYEYQILAMTLCCSQKTTENENALAGSAPGNQLKVWYWFILKLYIDLIQKYILPL